MGARGEHGAPVCSGYQSSGVLCALCLRAPCSLSQGTVLCVSEHRALCLRAPCSVSKSTVLWVSEHCALVLRLPCSVSQILFIIHCMFVEGKLRTVFFLQ